MRAHQDFHGKLTYAISLVVCLILISGIFVPMMVTQGGYMSAYGIPVLGVCMMYLVACAVLRAIQAYKRMIRSR